MWNWMKTTALLGAMTVMLVTMGGLVGGRWGALMMLFFSGAMNFFTWFLSDTIVLKTSGAVPVPAGELQWLEEDVAELAKAAKMPKPRVFIVPHQQSPNAFATGRSPSKGVVAVTAGLLENLDRREIRGVLAHELGHIRNRDTLVGAIAATFAGAITFAARMGMYSSGRRSNPLLSLALMIVAPMIALGLRMMVSRTREYAADRRAALITGDPEGLALALEGLSGGVRQQPMSGGNDTVHYIVNGFSGSISKLFSTHPPIEERARRLRALAAQQGS